VSIPPPDPIPFCPDVSTFLTLIGRNLISQQSKIPSWSALFSLTSNQLRDSGLEPARTRRYLLRWRQKFRDGEFGIGGDLRYVGEDGGAALRIVDIKSQTSQDTPLSANLIKDDQVRRVVVNVPTNASDEQVQNIINEIEQGTTSPGVNGMKIKGWDMIAGKNVRLLGSGKAELKASPGLWEHKRGIKVDGGERRKAEVRAKRRAAERKT